MARLLSSLFRRHHLFACAVALSLGTGWSCGMASARTILVTPNGGTGYDADNVAHPQTRSFLKDSFTDVRAGDTLRLLSESSDPTHVTRFAGRISLKNLRPTADPLVVEGLGARTRIVGLDVEDLRNCAMPDEDAVGCKERELSGFDALVLSAVAGSDPKEPDLLASILKSPPLSPLGLMGAPEGMTLFAIKPNPALKKSGFEMAACLDFESVDGVIVRNLHFENCWLVAVRARESSNITLQDAVIVGGSYGLAVSGEPKGSPASRIKVERVTWVQDASAFEGGDPFKGECPPERRWIAGCPGDMWRKLPWGTVHHGAYEHLNGALLGGIHLSGDVVFRHNGVANAYNGIRLTARSCSKAQPDGKPRMACEFNRRVWVYDNDFSYVRDNPVELEDWAEDAFIFHNRFHNVHAALSFDGMGGGPVYVFAMSAGSTTGRPKIGPMRSVAALACTTRRFPRRGSHISSIRCLTASSTMTSRSGYKSDMSL